MSGEGGEGAEGSVREIFAAEAAEHLATLRDATAPEADKRAAAANLSEAAALVGEHAIARAASELCERGPSAGALAALEGLVGARGAQGTGAPEDLGEGDESSLRRVFRDEADEIFERVARTLVGLGDRPPGDAVLSELMRSTHSLKGSAATVDLAAVGEAAHALEDVFDHLRARGYAWSQSLCDRLVEAVDAIRAATAAAADEGALSAELSRYYDVLSRAQALVRASRREATGKAPEPAAQPSAPTDSPPGEVGGAASPAAGPRRSEAVLRIDARRLDGLMDSMGELAFDRTRITRRATELGQLGAELERARQRLPAALRRLGASDDAGDGGDRALAELRDLDAELERQVDSLRRASSALLEDADALRRTTKSLQDGLTRVRMLTAASLFRQLAPQLRAMARAAGKRIALETTGGGTEFDKAVASHVADPLLQLLRNAVAHGIEPPELRAARDKPAEGKIAMAARQEGSAVVLEVTDDGAGIDPAALRRQFVDSGRWSEARAQLATDRDVIDALFEHGTSQRNAADSLAGRGVGLATVRESVARLGGAIETRSTPGRGTRFQIRLPVTAAVSEALLFKIGGEVFALPQSYVVETAHVSAASVPRHLKAQNRAVPLVSLHAVLGAPVPAGARALPAVVLSFAGKELAITCDRVVGPREIVIKQLGPILSALPLYAGGTISGSGKVQLILDPAELVRIAFPDGAGQGLAEGTASGRPRTDDAGGSDPAAAPRRPRALVVDDSASSRERIAEILADGGYRVDAAEDGARALAALRADPFELVVTDLEMPALGGLELLERLRAEPALAAIPVVVISARERPEERARAEALGARGVLAKPVHPDDLLTAARGRAPTDA